jgi:hypothetical protein
MTTHTYYAANAGERLAGAQQTLDTHITSSATGSCLACGLRACPDREAAMVVFSRSLRLPRRHPGATRPELVGLRRIDGHGLQGQGREARWA